MTSTQPTVLHNTTANYKLSVHLKRLFATAMLFCVQMCENESKDMPTRSLVFSAQSSVTLSQASWKASEDECTAHTDFNRGSSAIPRLCRSSSNNFHRPLHRPVFLALPSVDMCVQHFSWVTKPTVSSAPSQIAFKCPRAPASVTWPKPIRSRLSLPTWSTIFNSSNYGME